jgi:hypothetical protein
MIRHKILVGGERHRVYITAMFVLLTAAAALLGQTDQSEDADRVQRERWQKYYGEVASQYEMQYGAAPGEKLRSNAQPVLNYFNPVGGGQTLGSLFIWTHQGRPEIAGAIWSKQSGEQRRVIHSFHSLSLEPLQATRSGTVFWSPLQPGIEPVILSSVSAPALTGAQRLLQMRGLAKEFSATTVRDKAERPLRLLPQPIYRYEPSDRIEHDGGLFLWLEDWDPELLMLIETIVTSDGPKWCVGFARFTNLPVTARYKDTRIWNFQTSDLEPSQGGLLHRYISVHGVEVLPAHRDE